ncbi:MAG: hypothetical protein EBY43_04970 [Opitutae bacterium]|nr:hypothetical protein [Opitutae bacterium]
MEYSYEILKFEPRHKFVSVRYFAEGQDDYFHNFVIDTTTDEAITDAIKRYFYIVKTHWEFQDSIDVSSFTIEKGAIYSDSFDEEAYVNSFEPPLDDRIAFARQERNMVLAETDYLMFSDTPEPSQAMLDFRQALRDVPQQEGFPDNIVWPEKPAS